MASLLSPRAGARRARGLLDVGREVRHLLHLADLDDVAVPGGAARRPLDRLCLRLHLDQPVPADHLLGLGEGPVRHPGLPSGERDARAHRGWVVPVEREQLDGLGQRIVVLRYFVDYLIAWYVARLYLLV